MITLRKSEEIIKTIRQHRSVMVGTVVWSVVFAGLVVLSFLKLNLDIFGYSSEITTGIILLTILVILYKFYIWRKNTLIITNQRVVLNVRHNAFSKTVTELLYRDIYDISFKQAGPLAFIGRYGRIIIKTPSGSEITFDRAPSPASVVEVINKIRSGLITDFVSP